ncbi:hypothetical protein [Peribacillus sp. CSMR9]|uniref:hypothetical protein n=1 Tax=Peribacillus sp. CSMR9 TaxID=2981350 RepID=UPI0029546108|nr:hypothetical protein [Peribacillus sp. CSMR9]MDV7767332.1 hypothetical protein [Peribacillus sp. CSMR9]
MFKRRRRYTIWHHEVEVKRKMLGLFNHKLNAFLPETLAISRGSVTMQVTPRKRRMFESSECLTIGDSIWTWPSMNVGETNLPAASISEIRS